MKRFTVALVAVLLVSCSASEQPPIAEPSSSTLLLDSPVLSQGGRIPAVYSCAGRNISPALSWSGYDGRTLELALIMEDFDAPGGVFTHWVVFGIAPDVTEAALGQPPGGSKEGTNDFGKLGYGGPCPPRGAGLHRYRLTLYALNVRLPLAEGATAAELRNAMNGHVLDKDSLNLTFGRF